MAPMGKITVFYDGKCSLCSREIRHYQRIAPGDTFDWVDVTAYQSALDDHGLSLVNTLKYLHAKDRDGELHIGVDAFILMWAQLARWHWLAKLVSLRPVYQLADIAYRRFASVRFRRLAHCQLAEESDLSRLDSGSSQAHTPASRASD